MEQGAQGQAQWLSTASVRPPALLAGPRLDHTDWLIWRGLRQHGQVSLAREVEDSVVRLVERSGFREYFDPFVGEGYGSANFNWTAALLIDILRSRSVDR